MRPFYQRQSLSRPRALTVFVAWVLFGASAGGCDEADDRSSGLDQQSDDDRCSYTPQNIKPVTVYAEPSSTQSSNKANNLFDGDLSNQTGARWSASGLQSGSKSVKFDLGAEFVITEVRVHPYNNRAYQYAIKRSSSGSSPWSDLVDRRNNTKGAEVITDPVDDVPARYLELMVTGAHHYTGDWASIREVEIIGYSEDGDGGLDPNDGPGDNFDLKAWKITFADASEKDQSWLSAGNERSGEFFTDPQTGGMTFVCPNHGSTTSSSTKYARTELREMLRGHDTSISTQGINGNNWVTSTSSSSNRNKAGGVDGTLKATLSVDHVSTTYDDKFMVGRVIVGQIHAPDDEPCKLYYRKLPDHSKGSVYFAYEPKNGDDVIIPLIGSASDNASNPSQGIELAEPWSYEIDVDGHDLTVTVTRQNGSSVSKTITMDNYYDNAYLYFKAGVYNQNNGGDEDDYVRATFYELSQSHH